MAISKEITSEHIDKLFLDPMNPRLGRHNKDRSVSQEKVLELMRDWKLEELAVSFLESGFWPHEPVLATTEKLYGKKVLVVIEGNRRLAALKFLKKAYDGKEGTRKWKEISNAPYPEGLFDRVPCVHVGGRKEIDAFLGFRHVTGIKEWHPAEKAEYIAHLIDDKKLSYENVMRQIGSKTENVRRNYISYRILLQLQKKDEASVEPVEEKFSVLYLSLRETGVQKFLEIDIQAPPEKAHRPVPKEKLDDLMRFALWLFGDADHPPLFTDSRNVGKFAQILKSPKGVKYLKETPSPSFDLAVQKAGADEPELVKRVWRATDEVEQVLGRIHLYLQSEELIKAVDRFGQGAFELVNKFPTIKDKLIDKLKKD